jgi:regulator of extracellular matrix RemA (YlzA/DUF370 family)
MRKLFVCVFLAFFAVRLSGQSPFNSKEIDSERLVAKVAQSAARTIYMETHSANLLNIALKNARKGVRMHVTLSLGAATESNDLKRMFKRGDELWVDTIYDYSKRAIIAADSRTIGYTKTLWIHYDDDKVRDFISEWKSNRATYWVVPVR